MTDLFRHVAAAFAAALIMTVTFVPVLTVPQAAPASVLGLAPVV